MQQGSKEHDSEVYMPGDGAFEAHSSLGHTSEEGTSEGASSSDCPPAGSSTEDDLAIELARSIRNFSKLNMRSMWTIMSHGQFVTLDIIKRTTACEGAEGGVSVSAIAKHAHKPMSAISRNLGKLEDDGLIERRPDPDDRRNTLVTLTEQGREAHERTWEKFNEYLSLVIEEYGEDRICQLIDDLDDCYSAMGDALSTMRERYPELRDVDFPPAPPFADECGGGHRGRPEREHGRRDACSRRERAGRTRHPEHTHERPGEHPHHHEPAGWGMPPTCPGSHGWVR